MEMYRFFLCLVQTCSEDTDKWPFMGMDFQTRFWSCESYNFIVIRIIFLNYNLENRVEDTP